MAKHSLKITDNQRNALRAGTLKESMLGNVLVWLYQMPKMHPDLYKEVKKVLTLAGGEWSRKLDATVFTRDPSAVLELAQDEETTNIIDPKKKLQQFFTPDELARKLYQQHIAPNLVITDRTRVLEPSAGNGALLRVLRQYVPADNMWAVEIDPSQTKTPVFEGVATFHEDFLQVAPSPDGMADLIFMNPPFTNNQDIDHVLHAFRFLKPGGQLYALMSPGWLSGTQPKAKLDRWRKVFGAFGRMLEQVPAGTFKESGTEIRTLFIKLTHPNW